MVKYLRETGRQIVEMRQTETPRWGMTVDGYTYRNGGPTSRLVRLDGEKRWRRLMVLCFSNVGSLFLKIGGERLYVDEFDLPDRTWE